MAMWRAARTQTSATNLALYKGSNLAITRILQSLGVLEDDFLGKVISEIKNNRNSEATLFYLEQIDWKAVADDCGLHYTPSDLSRSPYSTAFPREGEGPRHHLAAGAAAMRTSAKD